MLNMLLKLPAYRFVYPVLVEGVVTSLLHVWLPTLTPIHVFAPQCTPSASLPLCPTSLASRCPYVLSSTLLAAVACHHACTSPSPRRCASACKHIPCPTLAS